MSKIRDALYLERKAKAFESARWIQPHADRALSQGQKEVIVPLRDLQDLLAFMRSQGEREKNEFMGKPLGFARPQDMRALLGGQVKGICLKSTRGSRFTEQVSFLSLPEHIADED
jgi:hypothetical protein